MKSYSDLREWLEIVDGMGQLARLEGAHWDLEIGAITDLVAKEPGPKPALLFDSIVDYPPGRRLLSSSLNSIERLALTCSMPSVTSDLGFVREWSRLSKTWQPRPPRVVERGPVLQNVCDRPHVDMLGFPAPRWHEHDGGRYIGTGTMMMTRDPDTGQVNAGCYRVMVHEQDSLGVYISPLHGGSVHRQKWFARGEPCPVAVSFGHDPVFLMAAAHTLGPNESELDWVGGIRNQAIDVIQGAITGLPIPAASELAIEGFFVPDETRDEGPFGEFTGYYAGGTRPESILRVERVMYRDDPIVLGAPRGRPPDDPTFWQTRLKASAIWDQMEAAGVPDVAGVWCHHPNSNLFVVVSIRQRYAGHARQAGLIAQQCAAGLGFGRWVIVVDDDIDPSNISDVLWALGTRADPERAIEITHFSVNTPLDAAKPPGDRTYSSRAVIDACRPWDWKDRFPVVAQTSPNLLRAVQEKWAAHIWPR
jgi:4-hydroxy-3-polyprenylbenzoate decarboxylase